MLYFENEVLKQDEEMKKGPLAKFLFGLAKLQSLSKDKQLIRTAIVTARDRNAGKRIIKTLRKWDIVVDEVFFLQGAKKKEVLASFGANIFFDDQIRHLESTAKRIPSVLIPFA